MIHFLLKPSNSAKGTPRWDEFGKKPEEVQVKLAKKALPPPWVLGKIEWPMCDEDNGTYTSVRFCPE